MTNWDNSRDSGSGSCFVGHKYFIMVTIENGGWMCYNVKDYTPGGVYVEYY